MVTSDPISRCEDNFFKYLYANVQHVKRDIYCCHLLLHKDQVSLHETRVSQHMEVLCGEKRSLRASERRRAKPSGGKESGEEVPRKWMLLRKIYSLLKKSELPKFILPVKINWLTFSSRGFAARFRPQPRSQGTGYLILPHPGERGETLAHAGHVPLWQLKTSGRGPL